MDLHLLMRLLNLAQMFLHLLLVLLNQLGTIPLCGLQLALQNLRRTSLFSKETM
jgi:hypothetical protein